MIEETTPDVLNAKELLMFLKKSSSSPFSADDGANAEPTSTDNVVADVQPAAASESLAAAKADDADVGEISGSVVGGGDSDERPPMFKKLVSTQARTDSCFNNPARTVRLVEKSDGPAPPTHAKSRSPVSPTAYDDRTPSKFPVSKDDGCRVSDRTNMRDTERGQNANGDVTFSKIEIALAAAAAEAGAAAAADVHVLWNAAANPAAAATSVAGTPPPDRTTASTAVGKLTAEAVAVDAAPAWLNLARPATAPSAALNAAAVTTGGADQPRAESPAQTRESEAVGAAAITKMNAGAVASDQAELVRASTSASESILPTPPESPAPGNGMTQREQREWMGEPSPAFRRTSAALPPLTAMNTSADEVPSSYPASSNLTPSAAGIRASESVDASRKRALSGVFTLPVPATSSSSSLSNAQSSAKRPRVATMTISAVPALPWGAKTTSFGVQSNSSPPSPVPSFATPSSSKSSALDTSSLPRLPVVPNAFPISTTSWGSRAIDVPVVTPINGRNAAIPAGSTGPTGAALTPGMPHKTPKAAQAVPVTPATPKTATTAFVPSAKLQTVPVVTPPPLAVLSKARSRAAAAAAALAAAEKGVAAK